MNVVAFPQSGKKEPAPDFESFYIRYYASALHYVCGKIPGRADAEDLVNDVFVYCLEHFDSYDPEKSSQGTWLFLIVNSRIKNYYRDRREQCDLSTLENTLFAEGEEMGKAVYLEQLRAQMGTALGTLPERQRQAVILRYFRDLSYEEIAERLSTTPGNVRVMVSRSLDRLASFFPEEKKWGR